jgi:hypothetical protein
MQSVIENQQGPVTLITHWMESAFVSGYSDAMQECNDTGGSQRRM